jgi:predicted homoserine dehydrogenase-like protein
MIYQQLFDRVKDPETVLGALIGAGDFGTAIVSQSSSIARLRFPIVADLDLAAARRALVLAGNSEGNIVTADTKSEVDRAWSEGKAIAVQDASLVMKTPVHVVCTATRVAEAGAAYAEMAISHGKHVVFVDKEADTVVAPILKRKADEAGVVFTTDDGDEPGLLMGLVGWARTLGMEVICGGNMDHILFDPKNSRVIKGSEGSGQIIHVAPEDRWALDPIPPGEARRYMEVRDRIFSPLLPIKETGDPVSHMSLPVNAVGLMPDEGGVHRPVCRITELPEVLCPYEEGGILRSRGVIEQPIILREHHEPHGGGGVFIIVTHPDPYSRNIMASKGLHHNEGRTSMVIYRPYHLCGAETAMSILCAALLRVPTGSDDIQPRVDIHAQARRRFEKGEVFGGDCGTLAFGFDTSFRTVMAPGAKAGLDDPIPYFMIYGLRAAQEIPEGAWITRRMVEAPARSALWRLRDEQDDLFFPAAP